MPATAAPDRVAEPEIEDSAKPEPARAWITLVWDDPVNLMSYVTYVFKKLFGYDTATATALMLDVHHKGKAVVAHGTREHMEHDVARLHAAGLWATLQHES